MEKVGIYPGSFDPIHKGHIDIINRAKKFVDKLYVAVADSPHKSPLFSLDERKEMINQEFSNDSSIEVITFDNLLVDFANSLEAKIIIRGLRVVSDFEYEFQMLGMNRQLDSNIETVFLMADAQRQSISSNFVKEIARLGGDISNFTNEFVANKLNDKFKS
jgi:pantetheine-phosphate adenylyltransferase|tara:strand:+ start:4385 stop:4867 length:483 start_codon:yes stop_codon:yes gene_type:complete